MKCTREKKLKDVSASVTSKSFWLAAKGKDGTRPVARLLSWHLNLGAAGQPRRLLLLLLLLCRAVLGIQSWEASCKGNRGTAGTPWSHARVSLLSPSLVFLGWVSRHSAGTAAETGGCFSPGAPKKNEPRDPQDIGDGEGFLVGREPQNGIQGKQISGNKTLGFLSFFPPFMHGPMPHFRKKKTQRENQAYRICFLACRNFSSYMVDLEMRSRSCFSSRWNVIYGLCSHQVLCSSGQDGGIAILQNT